MGFLIMIIVGGIAGWLAGQVIKGGGLGLVMNIIVGIVGGVVGGWLFGLLGISSSGGLVGQIVTSAVGAAVILYVASMLKGSK